MSKDTKNSNTNGTQKKKIEFNPIEDFEGRTPHELKRIKYKIDVNEFLPPPPNSLEPKEHQEGW